MRKIVIAFAIALFSLTSAALGQDFDFHTLDKLGAAAHSSTNVTLDGILLKWAVSAFAKNVDDDSGLKSVVANLKGIYVRAYKFDQPGQYNEADLDPLREYLRRQKWQAVVDVKEKNNSTQVFFQTSSPDGSKLGGVAVVSTEPAALTIVYINGDLSVDDLQKLSGNMGIPEMKTLPPSKLKRH